MAATSQSRRSREAVHTEMSIGGYTRLNEIGRGSFATVYQGVHTKTRTYVAIKSVNLSKLNKKLKDNLSSEIDILKRLHHPHIVALIDCHESPSNIHLVMEFCALGDLSMFIRHRDSLGDHRYTRDMIAKYPNPRGGALSEVIVRHFLKQLASALRFLRDRNLIHRDIKPQNLLLCPSPILYRSGTLQVVPYKGSEDSFDPITGLESLPMLKIADFGFARSLPATSLAETLCGSPLYMAPEILRYEKYDAKADLWSVGTVLYEMVVGKPPFRATNHMELLRKIEKSEDNIKFPAENQASNELKALIRALLKRNPVERLSFTDFFESTIITGQIPGLVGDDWPSDPPRAADKEDATTTTTKIKMSRSNSRQSTDMADVKTGRESPYYSEQDEITHPKPLMAHRLRSGTSPTSTSIRKTDSADGMSPTAKEQPRTAMTKQRPNVVSHTTTPGRQELIDRQPSVNAMERPRGRKTSSTGLPLPDKGEDKEREERERAAQDVAFERDYVVVEKRAVEVNAFADELAHSPRIQGAPARPGRSGAVTRRATTQAVLSSSPPNAATKAIQVIQNRPRAGSGHYRQSSYERRYGQSPASATSAISKALNMASGRLFGVGFSPPLAIGRGGRSPPMAYNPFPAYPTSQGSLMITGDGSKTQVAVDEDMKTVQIIEECATRSDVVYGFAEVKYKQLIPLAPSAQTNAPRKSDMLRHEGGSEDLTDDELTVDAIVTLSEEALVLYVKALSLLAKSMDIAGAWWARKNRGEAFGDPGFSKGADSTATFMGTRINNVVQWVRSRFNEVLEKAEFVRLKLKEAQNRLQIDHPCRPKQQSIPSSAAGSSADVVVSSGITAEKLMYDRALEMTRAAAINELTGEDLAGCEIAYVTAIRMLEAVLEEDEIEQAAQDGNTERSGSPRDGDRVAGDCVQTEEHQVVLKLISSIRGRLTSLRKRLALVTKRVSAPPPLSGGSKVPQPNFAPISHAGGATPPK